MPKQRNVLTNFEEMARLAAGTGGEFARMVEASRPLLAHTREQAQLLALANSATYSPLAEMTRELQRTYSELLPAIEAHKWQKWLLGDQQSTYRFFGTISAVPGLEPGVAEIASQWSETISALTRSTRLAMESLGPELALGRDLARELVRVRDSMQEPLEAASSPDSTSSDDDAPTDDEIAAVISECLEEIGPPESADPAALFGQVLSALRTWVGKVLTHGKNHRRAYLGVVAFVASSLISVFSDEINNLVTGRLSVAQAQRFAREFGYSASQRVGPDQLANYRIVTAGALNVRERATRHSRAVSSLRQLEVVRIVYKKRNWTLVEWAGMDDTMVRGWVFSRYLQKIDYRRNRRVARQTTAPSHSHTLRRENGDI